MYAKEKRQTTNMFEMCFFDGCRRIHFEPSQENDVTRKLSICRMCRWCSSQCHQHAHINSIVWLAFCCPISIFGQIISSDAVGHAKPHSNPNLIQTNPIKSNLYKTPLSLIFATKQKTKENICAEFALAPFFLARLACQSKYMKKCLNVTENYK